MCWGWNQAIHITLIQFTATRCSRIPSYEFWARRKALGVS